MMTTLSSVPSQRHSRFWVQITKLVVIKRGEALNLGALVVYLGFENRSAQEAERRGFTIKPITKYVDDCLDIVQLQCAKAVMTPLTEQKSLNLHDETTACDQDQHSLFRAVVGKLQYITGVRLDLMFVTKKFVIQTCITNICRFDMCQESVEIFERNTRTDSLPDDTCIETERPEQYFETCHVIL